MGWQPYSQYTDGRKSKGNLTCSSSVCSCASRPEPGPPVEYTSASTKVSNVSSVKHVNLYRRRRHTSSTWESQGGETGKLNSGHHELNRACTPGNTEMSGGKKNKGAGGEHMHMCGDATQLCARLWPSEQAGAPVQVDAFVLVHVCLNACAQACAQYPCE